MYRTTQVGTVVLALLVSGIGLTAAVGFSSGWHPATLIVGSMLIAVLVLFRSLTIEIDSSELRCFFGDGLIRRRFPLADIASAAGGSPTGTATLGDAYFGAQNDNTGSCENRTF